MAKFRKIQSSFTSGEISPRLLARVDLQSYEQAVKTLENGVPLSHGGVKRRPGSIYVSTIKDQSKISRLLPFVYNRTDSFALVMNSGVFRFIKNGAYVTSGSPVLPYELSHPYSDTELEDLTYAQSGNLLFLAHPKYPPKQLTRVADDNWTLTDISFLYGAIADYWFENAYLTFKLVTSGSGFNLNDVIVITTDGSGGIVGIDTSGVTGTGTIAGTTINAALDPPATGSPLIGQTWTLTCTLDSTNREEFSVVGSISGQPAAQWSANDYPKAVSFFEQRLYFGGSVSRPQTIWGSATGDYTQLTLGPDDSDAVQFQMASNRYSQIMHLEAARTLLPLSYNSEFSMSGTANGGITPTGVNIREQSFYGTSNIRPARIGQEVIFVQRDKKKIRAISYDVTIDSNVAPDISILAEHITGDGVSDMTYQQDPDSTAWLVREDGVLLSLTHMRSQEVTAWARHITDGKYLNVTTIPEGSTDTVYTIVERTINSNTVRYIEQLDPIAYTDSALRGTFLGSPGATVWSGLSHLEGKSVAIRADEKVHPNKTVSSGSITLDYSANDVEIGLPYTTKLEMLHPEIALSDGTSQGSATAVVQAVLRVKDAVGLRVNDIDLPTFIAGNPMDSPPVPYTGDVEVNITGWRTPFNLKIEQLLPVPATILGVILKVVVNDA